MRKGLKYILYPLAIVIVILAFLHLSYIIDYKNIDEIYIGLILLLLSKLGLLIIASTIIYKTSSFVKSKK